MSDDGLPSKMEWDRLFEKETSFIHVSVGSLPLDRRTPDGVMSEILIKLCADDKALMEMVLIKFERSNNYAATWKEMKPLFMASGEKRGIVIVLDGIERIVDCQWVPLVDAFTEFRDWPREGTAKVILCSLALPELSQRFRRDLDIEITPETIYGDLHLLTERYVERISRHHGIDSIDDVMKDKIRRMFENGPQGDCLWKDCIQEFLSHNCNKQEMEAVLSKPLMSVQEIYFKMLLKLEDLDATWKALAYQTLALLICARRPYDMEELLIALAVETDRDELRPRKLLTQPRRVLTSLLGPLIRFRTRIVAGGIGTTETRMVTLRHETVYDFLLQQRPGLCFPLRLEECHLLAAKKCIAYLSLDRFATTKGCPYPRGRGWQNHAEPEDIYLRYAAPHFWEHVMDSGDLGIDMSRELIPALENLLQSPQILSWLDYIHINTGAERIEFAKQLKLAVESLDEWHNGLGERLGKWIRNPKLREKGSIVEVVRRWRAELLGVINRSIEQEEDMLYEVAVVRPRTYGGYGECNSSACSISSDISNFSLPRILGSYFPTLATAPRDRESTRFSRAPSFFPPSSPGSPTTPSPRRISFDYDELESDDEEEYLPKPPVTSNKRMTRSTATLSRLMVRKPVPGTASECCSVRGSVRSPSMISSMHGFQEQFATMSTVSAIVPPVPPVQPVPAATLAKKRMTRVRETRIPTGVPETLAEEDGEVEPAEKEAVPPVPPMPPMPSMPSMPTVKRVTIADEKQVYELESPAEVRNESTKTPLPQPATSNPPPFKLQATSGPLSPPQSVAGTPSSSRKSSIDSTVSHTSIGSKRSVIEPGPGQILNKDARVSSVIDPAMWDFPLLTSKSGAPPTPGSPQLGMLGSLTSPPLSGTWSQMPLPLSLRAGYQSYHTLPRPLTVQLTDKNHMAQLQLLSPKPLNIADKSLPPPPGSQIQHPQPLTIRRAAEPVPPAPPIPMFTPIPEQKPPPAPQTPLPRRPDELPGGMVISSPMPPLPTGRSFHVPGPSAGPSEISITPPFSPLRITNPDLPSPAEPLCSPRKLSNASTDSAISTGSSADSGTSVASAHTRKTMSSTKGSLKRMRNSVRQKGEAIRDNIRERVIVGFNLEKGNGDGAVERSLSQRQSALGIAVVK